MTAPALLSDAALAEIRERHDALAPYVSLLKLPASTAAHADREALLADNARLRAIVSTLCGDLPTAARAVDAMKESAGSADDL